MVVVTVALGCAPARQEWPNTYEGDGEDLFVLDDDLACLADEQWALVGKTRITNALGRRDEAVALAESGEQGAYPVGTIVQLLPSEAAVKRGAGFSPETRDWEFIKLDVGTGRTVITERGTTNIGNPGGTCISCHEVARDFDLVCFTNTTCAPLPFFIDTEIDPQTEDARCAAR